MATATSDIPIRKVVQDEWTDATDVLAIEEPLEISLTYDDGDTTVSRTISITMRTPGQDEWLATGFLFTEGILQDRAEIAGVKHISFDPNRIHVQLAPGSRPRLQSADRNFYTTSSCGVCGKASIDAIHTVSAFTGRQDELRIAHELLYTLPDKLRDAQAVFDATGGLHASAVFDTAGNLMMLCEDVGRHNALDKLIGRALQDSLLPLNDQVLLLSGRASFELIQKAAMAGIRVIAAVGAPSSLAVALAAESNITLTGFLRGPRFNIYSHPHRIII